VVAAASYEARRFGVRSAMPSSTARRCCPDLLFVPTRFEVYRAVSQQIREIFYDYTDLVEPLSLDEAYLDVTENKRGWASGTHVATDIRRRIREATGLTASAGVSFNKFLAKTASDCHKPDGLTVIRPDQAAAFLAALPIERFHGVGPKTAARMRALGINGGADLLTWPEAELARQFGKAGRHYYRIVRADDDRPVNPDRIRKSVGKESTFHTDLHDTDEIRDALRRLTDRVWERVDALSTYGRTVTLKVKTPDFRLLTRSVSFQTEVRSPAALLEAVLQLLDAHREEFEAARLLGVAVSNLEGTGEAETPGRQLHLSFEAPEE
ncbi:MAG: DNA polymerase IV, partial [Catalinimonas sp.]